MADYTWPFSDSDARYLCEAFDEALEFNVELSVSRSGKVSTLSLPGARWRATMQFPDTGLSELVTRRQIEAFLLSLRGGADRLLMWNPLTPQPLGTMRGPVTLAAAVLAGATTAQITGGAPAASTTLLRGDRIAIGGQRVVLTADATANGSGVMTVSFQPAHRSGAASGLTVTLTRPTTKYVLTQPVVQMPARGDRLPAFAVELVEEFVPIAVDPFWSNVSLLLHGGGVNGSSSILDSSPTQTSITAVGDATISTAQSKFGDSSILIGQVTGYLTAPDSNNWDFGAGDFCIEAWVRPSTTQPAAYGGVVSKSTEAAAFGEFTFGFNSSGQLNFGATSGGSGGSWNLTSLTSAAGVVVLGVWQHIAITRSGSAFRLFRDGVQVATSTATGAITNEAALLTIGANKEGGSFKYAGNIDELRITKGAARYTANFNPPTQAFPDF